MPQSLSSILIHLVFSTKHREPFITADIELDLHDYLGGIFRRCECPSLLIGGTADHIHALVVLSRTKTVASIVEDVKSSSSKWIKTKGAAWQAFQWQAGYGAFSVSQSGLEKVKSYIANQKQHHGQTAFQDEYRLLCQKHGIEIDERYVWD
ncbi:MAG: IS200/IS605 family transposase [Acidobacteria bacterium]|nr:IS200/IS605 family transposase [Acidobacteriota bacterium]MBI3422933.1 IS200/IS605 family transposase [Acidobacteriota bacterium]